jgi:hypothetical protein
MIVTYFAKSASRFLQQSWETTNVMKSREHLINYHMF